MLFVGHLDTRVYVSDAAYLDIGAGSLPCISNVAHVPIDHLGLAGTIGRFCEISPSAQLMAGGEHDHDQPVNITFTALPILDGRYNPLAMKPIRRLQIGSGVVVSAGARVLAGVSVGDGAVIGANSVVSRNVEPWQIVAGLPARPLRSRQPCLPWWDFDTAYLLANMADLQTVARSDGPHVWRKDRPRVVIKKTPTGFSIEGVTEGEAITPIASAPVPVRDYLIQAFDGRPNPVWKADFWA